MPAPTPEVIKQFRSLVIQATSSLVTLREQRVAQDIPLSVFGHVFTQVFNNDMSMAKDILFGRIENINDSEAVEQVRSIVTMPMAAEWVADAVAQKQPMLMISDVDSDGALAQSIALEFRRETGADLSIQQKHYDPALHGFNVSQIDAWLRDSEIDSDNPFTVLVTDLGSNQQDMQHLFETMYPNGRLVIIDHHKPMADRRVKQQTANSLWVSPFTKGSVLLALRNGGGISAGYLFSEVASQALVKLKEQNLLTIDDSVLASRLEDMRKMGLAANLLDGVQSDTRLKPLYEEDVGKAMDLAALARSGRNVDRWIREGQDVHISALLPIVGREVVDELLVIRHRYMQQNHYAGCLLSAIRDAISEDFKMPEAGISEIVLRRVAQGTIEESSTTNYLMQLRPWLFNMSYESSVERDVKRTWLSLVESCLKSVKDIDRQVLEQIRKFELVREISSEHVLITQPASREIELVFAPRELKAAYQLGAKSVTMSVSAIYPDKVVLSCNSEMSMFDLLSQAEEEFPYATLNYQGNNGAGGLTVRPVHGTTAQDAIQNLLTYVQHRVSAVQANQVLSDPLMVNPIHLPLLQEMFSKMRLHVEGYAAPTLLMKVGPDTVFEDRYSMKKSPVSDLVQAKPWDMTTDPLDFSGQLKLMIPNQVLRQMLAQGYGGAMKLAMLPTGHFIASKAVAQSQIPDNVATLTLPLERDREELKAFYKKHFQHAEVPAIELSNEEIANALHFVSDGHAVQTFSESTSFATLLKTKTNALVVTDVEADGGGNAQEYNKGLLIFERQPHTGTVLSKEAFVQLADTNPDEIRHFEVLDDGSVRVNELLKKTLVSILIKSDGGERIRISIKSQALTNISEDFLFEVGMDAAEAQQHVLNILKQLGPFIVQAHNLPYDNNIIRVNMPEVYKLMEANLHLDTAVPARENQIAYMSLTVSKIGGADFYNAPHQGYNLTSLLENSQLDTFEYPSIKGTHILRVRGDEVSVFNKSSRVSVKLPEARNDVAFLARSTMGVMSSPRYSIQLMMRMATVHDMLRSMPVKFVKEIPFNDFGLSGFPRELWHAVQYNYAYDRSVDENLMLMMQIPAMREYMQSSIKFDSYLDMPDELVDARAIGTGEMYNPNRKCKTDDDAAALKAKVLEFSGLYVVRANLIKFLNNNPENAERFSKAWLYDLVLHRHEMTRKEIDQGMLQGLSEELGVPADMLEQIYRDVYRYCDMRGIQSYKAHETHNNIGLDGDVVQEKHVFDHMMKLKFLNPYIPRSVSLKLFRDPNAPVVDVLVKQVARSTMMQLVRKITGISMDGDVVAMNSYSSRQLENYSRSGISELTRRLDDESAQFKCKTLSDSDSEVKINLPYVDKQAFLKLPEAERRHLEELVELVVTGMVISNSSSVKGLSADAKTLVEKVGAHDLVLTALKASIDRFGMMIATSRADAIKTMMQRLTQKVLGVKDESIPANREIEPEDLDIVHQAFALSIEMLRNRGVNPAMTEGELADCIDLAKSEYYCAREARRTGEKVAEVPASLSGGVLYPPLAGSSKSAQTRMLTAMSNVDKRFKNISPELGASVLTTKKDPIRAILQSPLVALAMNSENPSLQNTLRSVIKNWTEETKVDMKNNWTDGPDAFESRRDGIVVRTPESHGLKPR